VKAGGLPRLEAKRQGTLTGGEHRRAREAASSEMQTRLQCPGRDSNPDGVTPKRF